MKTVVVTGASRGLGLALANEFSSNDWSVIGIGRSVRPEELDSSIRYEQFDGANAEACEDFWKSLPSEQTSGEICLVNNAGGYAGGGLLESKPEDFEKQMRSNYFSAVYMTRGLATVVPKARIVNIISENALAAKSTDPAYGASKAAEMYFFKTLQKEFKPDKYQITNLYPSSIATSGPNSKAIDPGDLARYVLQLADSEKTYYIADATLRPAA